MLSHSVRSSSDKLGLADCGSWVGTNDRARIFWVSVENNIPKYNDR